MAKDVAKEKATQDPEANLQELNTNIPTKGSQIVRSADVRHRAIRRVLRGEKAALIRNEDLLRSVGEDENLWRQTSSIVG